MTQEHSGYRYLENNMGEGSDSQRDTADTAKVAQRIDREKRRYFVLE
jgi:hypothetical protein